MARENNSIFSYRMLGFHDLMNFANNLWYSAFLNWKTSSGMTWSIKYDVVPHSLIGKLQG